MNSVADYEESLDHGIELFNDRKFFEAHEAWEPLWLCAEEPRDKQFLQGLILAAGAFLHYMRRECAGASVLLEKSLKALEDGASIHAEIRLDDFLQALNGLRDTFKRCVYDVQLNDLPRILTYSRPSVQRQLY